MNGSSNVLVLGVTGQVGKRVATNLKRKKATLSVGSRRRANLRELADQFGASRFIDLDDPGVSQFPDHSRGRCNYHPATYRRLRSRRHRPTKSDIISTRRSPLTLMAFQRVPLIK